MQHHNEIKRVVTLDFESFYSKELTLTHMPTQAYIEHPDFHVIGVGVSERDAAGNHTRYEWIPGPEQARKGIESLRLDEPGTLTVAHNAMFDGGILEYHMGIKPWMYLCTMMGSRPHLAPFNKGGKTSLASLQHFTNVPPKMGYVAKAIGKTYSSFSTQELSDYGDYCLRDVDICEGLAELILKDLPWEELQLIDLTVKMFTRPKFVLDGNVLETYLTDLIREKKDLLKQCGVEDPRELRSNDLFAALLIQSGMPDSEIPRKISPATGEETYAFAKTDADFKEKILRNDDETIQILGAARVGHKSTLAESRAERFLKLSRLPSRFGAPLLYYGAHTGRYSGFDKLNLQNLPRGSDLRRALTAPPGYRIVAVDLSQIEARILAWLAGEKDLLHVFETGRDPYRDFASRVYGVPYDKVAPSERRVAKAAILGLGYNMGPMAFEDYLATQGVTDLSKKQIKDLVYKHYRGTYSKIVDLWARAHKWIYTLRGEETELRYKCLFIANGFIGLPNGMCIHYPDMGHQGVAADLTYGAEGNRKKIYHAKIIENCVQALARIVMTRAMLWLANRGLYASLTVHDEALYVCHERDAEKLGAIVQRVLCREVPWMEGLKLDAEVKTGVNYGELA